MDENSWVINERVVRHLLARNKRCGRPPATARELAERLGKSEPYVSKLLTGQRESFGLLLEIAAVLEVEDWRTIALLRAEPVRAAG